jgi:hypothetical protein
MQNETQSTSRPSLRPSDPASTPSPTPHAASAFSEVFLGQLRRIAALALDRGRASAAAQPATQAETAFAGPFAVEAVERAHEGPGHALLRPSESPEGAATADGPAAVLERRDEALRLAAVLPALADAPQHRLGEKRHPLGVALHHGRRFVGRVAPAASRLSGERRQALETHLDLARYLATHPHALAMILESVGPEALPLLGRALARRVEALMP